MDLIAWIILGAISGWIASLIVKTDSQQGLLGDILLGIIGAVVGGWIFNFFGGMGVTGLNIQSVIVAVIGAIVVVAVKRKLS